MCSRKIVAVVFSALFVITLIGCSSSSSSTTASSTSGETSVLSSSAASLSSSTAAPSFNPVTVADDDKVTIRVDALGSDPDYVENYGFVCYLENKTNSKVKFAYEEGSFSVDGAMMTPKFFHDVMPGKHDNNGYLVFLAQDGITGYDKLKNVEGVIELRNPDSFELIASYPFAASYDSNASANMSSSASATSNSGQSSEASTPASSSSATSAGAATSTSTRTTTSTGAASTTNTQNTSKKVTDEELQGMLLANAQTVVKDHLKSPSSAKFPWGFDEYVFLDKGPSSKHPGYTTYSIEGPVEAQNSYGTQLKGKFKVVIDYSDKEGMYYEVSCSID